MNRTAEGTAAIPGEERVVEAEEPKYTADRSSLMIFRGIHDGAAGFSRLLERPEEMEWMLEQLELAVVVADRDGAVRFASREARRLLGASLPEAGLHEWPQILGLFLPDALTPLPADRVPLARALKGEETACEVLYRRSDGASRGTWISITARPILTSEGEISGGVALMRDCTEHRCVLEQVAEALGKRGEATPAPPDDCPACLPFYQRLLKYYDWVFSAVEQTADSVVITDHRGVIQYVNPGFTHTTGFSAEDALGKTPRILKSGKHDPEFYQNLWAKILSGEPFTGLIVNRKKSGEIYTAQQSISPIHNDTGRITHFVSVLKDVTDLLKSKERELQMGLAREVQERFYGVSVDLPGFDIAGNTVQAEEIGGDYFDFLPLEGGRLGIVTADVTGHGVSAALVMAEARAYLRAFCDQTEGPAEIMTRLNLWLTKDLLPHQFVTLCLVCLDTSTHCMRYTNAGHVPGILLDGNGALKATLRSLDPPLGIFPDRTFHLSEPITLQHGDTLVLITDGVMERADANNREFGVDSTARYVAEHRNEPARRILEGLEQAVRSFGDDEPFLDDVTTVVLKVTG